MPFYSHDRPHNGALRRGASARCPGPLLRLDYAAFARAAAAASPRRPMISPASAWCQRAPVLLQHPDDVLLRQPRSLNRPSPLDGPQTRAGKSKGAGPPRPEYPCRAQFGGPHERRATFRPPLGHRPQPEGQPAAHPARHAENQWPHKLPAWWPGRRAWVHPARDRIRPAPSRVSARPGPASPSRPCA